MRAYTVIGFYTDNGQLFAGHRRATSAANACALAPAGVHVVAVVRGTLNVLADDGKVWV